MLDVVVLLIELLLGLGKESFSSLVLLNLNLTSRKLRATVAVHLHHLSLASLGGSLLLALLLLTDRLHLFGLLLGSNLSSRAHTSDISGCDDGSRACSSLSSLFNVSSH